MGLQQSNLSATGLGYDLVVSMTQAGLTEAVGDKYDSLPPKEIIAYWMLDNNTHDPDLATPAMLNLPGNLNPFTVAAWTSGNGANAHITALQQAHFALAVKATPGLPDSVQYPKILALNSDGTADLTIYFLDLQVVAAIYDATGNTITQYLNFSQDDDTPQTIVYRLPFTTITSNNNLPANVQAMVGNSPDISVQQLVLDFTNGSLVSGLNIPGLDQGKLYPGSLNNTFAIIVLQALADAGVTTVGYAGTRLKLDPASLAITSMAGKVELAVDANGKVITNPTTDQLSLTTLDLYCSTNGDPLPAPVQLPWNWLDTASEASAYDGTMAYKYGTIVNYFKSKMDGYVAGNCFKPALPYDENQMFFAPVLTGGQTPQYVKVTTVCPIWYDPFYGRMLYYSYQSDVVTNQYGDGRSMSMNTSFGLSVSFKQETITVEQTLMIHADMNFGAGVVSVNVVNTFVVDTYTVGVDTKGYLLLTPSTTKQDNSDLNVNLDLIPSFFQDVVYELADYADKVVSGTFDIDPLNQLQQFIFPGGRTFLFSDAAFTAAGDLVSHIKFVEDPV